MIPVRGDARSDEALSLDFYMRLASAAAGAALAHQQALMLLPPKLTKADLRGLALDGGIVVDPGVCDPRVTLFEQVGLSVVTIERDLGREGGSFVACRTDEITRAILDHLADRGAQRIALLRPRAEWAWTSETLAANEAWTSEHRGPRIVARASMVQGERTAYEATLRLLARRSPPDAIFVVVARFIRGVLRAAHEAGRHVSGSLMVAAGVDGVHARDGDPPVTAWDLHPERQGPRGRIDPALPVQSVRHGCHRDRWDRQ